MIEALPKRDRKSYIVNIVSLAIMKIDWELKYFSSSRMIYGEKICSKIIRIVVIKKIYYITLRLTI